MISSEYDGAMTPLRDELSVGEINQVVTVSESIMVLSELVASSPVHHGFSQLGSSFTVLVH